jgi:hypothetical protein
MSVEEYRTTGDGGRGGNATVQGRNSSARGGDGGEGVVGAGGRGGDAEVHGDNSVAVGGKGGRGGLGNGGPGGRATARGHNMFSAGGEGGEANQPDGRGGRGGQNGYLALSLPDYQLPDGRWISEFGRGGDSVHSPQYAARLMVLEECWGRAISMYAASAGILDEQASASTLEHLNELLCRNGHAWRVRITAGCFEFYEP